jgi:hypothetical protein
VRARNRAGAASFARHAFELLIKALKRSHSLPVPCSTGPRGEYFAALATKKESQADA